MTSVEWEGVVHVIWTAAHNRAAREAGIDCHPLGENPIAPMDVAVRFVHGHDANAARRFLTGVLDVEQAAILSISPNPEGSLPHRAGHVLRNRIDPER